MSSLPVLRTQLSVCFLSPLPDSLPQLFLRCLPRAFAFGLSPSASLSFVRSVSGSCYSASVSSFPLSSRPCLTVACPVLPLCLSASLLFHFCSTRFPVFLFRFFVLGSLFVSFHPTRFRSHSRFPGASLLFRFLSSTSLLGFSLASLSFVHCRSVLTTQLSVFLFPSSRSPLSAVPSVLSVRLAAPSLFLFWPACFHAVLPISVLSSLQFLSPSAVSPHSGYLDASASSFRFRPLPLASALGSVTRLKRPLIKHTRQSLAYVSRQLGYNSTCSLICQHLFSKFFNKFYFSFLGTSTRTSVLVITNISTYHPLLRVR